MSTTGDDANVELEAYRLLNKTFILLDDCDRRFFAEYGLSSRQFWTLKHLYERQGLSMVELSRLLVTDKSNVTGIIDRLERLHLVTRSNDAKDRRVIFITLTEKGRALYNHVREQHEQRVYELMGIVTQGNLHSLVEYLQAISGTIETYLEQGKI